MAAARVEVPGSGSAGQDAIAALRQVLAPGALIQLLHCRDTRFTRAPGEALTCRPVRVLPRGEQRFVVEYHVRVRAGDDVRAGRWFAELLPGGAEARFAKLTRWIATGRLVEPRPASAACLALVPTLQMIVRSSELDHRLPALALLVEPERLAGVLAGVLGTPIRRVSIDVLGHRLGKRCTVRISFENKPPGANAWRRRSVIGKLYAIGTERGRKVAQSMAALRRNGFGRKAGTRVPAPLAYLEDLRLLLMEDVAARPLAELSGATFRAALATAGRALAGLHHCPVCVPASHSVDDELRVLERWVVPAEAFEPKCAEALGEAFASVSAALDGCRGAKPALVHRDFYDRQVLIDDHSAVPIDFDMLCMGDPALDVGNFLAHLALCEPSRGGPRAVCSAAFLSGYSACSGPSFGERVRAYERSALLRLAALCTLWPSRQHLAPALLRRAAAPERAAP